MTVTSYTIVCPDGTIRTNDVLQFSESVRIAPEGIYHRIKGMRGEIKIYFYPMHCVWNVEGDGE